MASWLVGSFESDCMYGAQTLINCVRSFSVVKLIFVLVLPLLMYACRQKYTKKGPKDAGLDDSRTTNETLPEKTSDAAATGPKKRRRRKKKNSEKQEQPIVVNKAREHTDTSTREEVKVIKIRSSVANSVQDAGDVKKRNKLSRSARSDDAHGTLKLDKKNTKNAETTGRVEAKDRKKGNKDHNKSEIPEDSLTVRDVREVKNMGGGSKKLIRDAVCLVLCQDTVCRNNEKRNENSPRCVNKLHDVSEKGVVKRDCPNLKKTDRQDVGAGRKSQAQWRFSSDSPEEQPSKLNTNADHERRGTAPRRGSFDCDRRKGPRENELSDRVQDALMDPDADREVFEAPFTVDKARLEHSVGAVKDIKAANRQEEEETLGDQQSQFVIDPEVRERIANPKYPVRVPDKPLEHLSYRDDSWRPDHIKGANKSLVGGLFGRKWREELERKEIKREMEEAAEEERYKAEMMKFGDNICPTFMVWGVCHRGDHCPLRHPSYRYLERPPRKVVSPEPAPEVSKRHPNSYAAILEKRNNAEPEEFFNEAVLYQAETTHTNATSYSKALVNSRQGQQKSNVPVTKENYEEAWPSLGSPVQGRGVEATKQAPLTVPGAWSTQKGPRIVNKNQRITADKLQTASDAVIAQELQADEYALNDYGDVTSNYPEEEFSEDTFYHQLHDDEREDNESSPNIHHDAKVLELEQFDSHFQSSPVIMEQSSRHTDDPTPPRVVSSPCDICMDRPKDATLVCGHRFCYVCALQMRLDERVCAICRRCIVSVIKTYN